ncbi:MAG: DUF4971 domain-containing protein [Rikenellaceae bacterium]
MNRTLIKSLRRATLFAMSLSLAAFAAVSCGDDDTTNGGSYDSTGTGLELTSFNVSVIGGAEVEVSIDNESREVCIYGISNGNYITDVEFEATLNGKTADASFIPALDTKVGNWDSSFETFLYTTNVGVKYTIMISEYDRGTNNILYIDPTNTKQEVVFIGADMERSQYSLQKAPNAQEMANWCFKDIDWDVLRISYDKQQELVEGTKNFEFYDNALLTMSYIETANPNIKYFATLKSDYNGYDSSNNYPDWISDYSTKSLDTKKYATFLCDYLEYFHTKGHTISYMSTSKEYTQCNTPARTKEVIDYMIEDLAERGVPCPMFCDASTWSSSQGTAYVEGVISNSFEDRYWGFCTHNYNSSSSDPYQYEGMVNAANSITKTNRHGTDQYYSIASETGAGTMGAYSGVDANSSMPVGTFREKCEFYADGMQGEMIFEVFSRSVASESRAVYCNYSSGDDGTRLSNYYAIQSHGNFFIDGMYYLGSSKINMMDDIYSMQFANDDQIYVAIINIGTTAIDNLLLSIKSTGVAYNGTVRRHVMDEYTVKTLGDLDGLYYDETMTGGELEMDIPATSLTFIKITDLSKSDSEDDESGASGMELSDLTDGGTAWQ